MGITTKDLARLCGVSRTTVHRALNDTGRINDETKQMILRVARENGYRPDLLARGLVKGTTNYFGIVVLDIRNGHFTQMLDSAGRAAKEKGYFTNICLHDNDTATEKEILRRLTDYRVAGILLSSIVSSPDYEDFLRELDVPVVTTDNPISKNIPYIGIDNEAAMLALSEYAVEKGYERVIFVCPSLSERGRNIEVHKLRKKGFLSASKKYPDTEFRIIKNEDYESECKDILKENNARTAFLCTADMFALSLMESFTKDGLIAGRDYGLSGFDGIDMLAHISPRLTTIDNRATEIGASAIELLVRLAAGEDAAPRTLLPYRLVTGETL